jgi:predicted peptidase
MKKLFPILLFALISFVVRAQDLSAYKKEFLVDGADTLKYRILYPENFDATKKYPVVFFLHGSGERGNDNEKQLSNGAKMFLADNFRQKYPAIIIFPQCAEESYWANVEIEAINTKRFFNFIKGGSPTKSMSLLLQLTDKMSKESFTDAGKIYVGGLSMGGMGTFEILRRRPKTFAAAFAICGGDNVANVKKYKHIPLWIFHGGMDDVVNPQLSYAIYKELQALGKEPKYTVYPKANHNSWDSTFSEPGLMDWLFSKEK